MTSFRMKQIYRKKNLFPSCASLLVLKNLVSVSFCVFFCEFIRNFSTCLTTIITGSICLLSNLVSKTPDFVNKLAPP